MIRYVGTSIAVLRRLHLYFHFLLSQPPLGTLGCPIWPFGSLLAWEESGGMSSLCLAPLLVPHETCWLSP